MVVSYAAECLKGKIWECSWEERSTDFKRGKRGYSLLIGWVRRVGSICSLWGNLFENSKKTEERPSGKSDMGKLGDSEIKEELYLEHPGK